MKTEVFSLGVLVKFFVYTPHMLEQEKPGCITRDASVNSGKSEPNCLAPVPQGGDDNCNY